MHWLKFNGTSETAVGQDEVECILMGSMILASIVREQETISQSKDQTQVIYYCRANQE